MEKTKKMKDQFFSINLDSLPSNQKLDFDLYVNSSLNNKLHFVRVFPKDDLLDATFITYLKNKYPRIYVHEAQRDSYLKILNATLENREIAKVQVLKDTAVKHMKKIFEMKSEEELISGISGCYEVTLSMVEHFATKNLDQIKKMIGDLSFHDFYTFDHSINVSMYSISMYRFFYPNAPTKNVVNMGLGALLHDIGKIKVPTDIINKPSELTEIEFNKIKSHPVLGKQMMLDIMKDLPAQVDWSIIIKIINQHHENFDGTGYPNKISGDEIHHMAKICTFADILDALTTKRSYNQVVSVEKAIEIIAGLEGKKIDPEMFKKFLEFMNVGKKYFKKETKLSDKFDPSVPFKTLDLEENKNVKKDEPLKMVKSY